MNIEEQFNLIAQEYDANRKKSPFPQRPRPVISLQMPFGSITSENFILIEIRKKPLEVVLYSKYYWLMRYVKKYNEVNGYDAGMEQQQFKLIEEFHGIPPVDRTDSFPQQCPTWKVSSFSWIPPLLCVRRYGCE